MEQREEGTMDVVTIPVMVGTDRRLVIELPPSTPIGPADVVILPRTNGRNENAMASLAREAARATLRAADFLSTDIHAPDGTPALTDEEIAHLGQLPADARPSEDVIDEDRGRSQRGRYEP